MKTRHALMLAVVVVMAAGFVHAVASGPSPSNEASVPAGIMTAAPDSSPTAADPYLNAAEFTSEAGTTSRSCSFYSNDCVFEGGPCGPVPGVCHCALHPTGFLCGGVGI